MTKTEEQAPAVAAPKFFDITSRYMADHVDVVIKDTLADRDHDTGIRIRIKSSQSMEALDTAMAWRSSHEPEGEPDEKGDKRLSSKQMIELWREQAIAVTESWDNIGAGTESIECNPANVRALYTNPNAQWIYIQVLKVLLDDSNFFVKPRSS